MTISSPALPLQELEQRRTFVRDESPRRYPRNALVEQRRALFWLSEVSPFGFQTLPVTPEELSAKKLRSPHFVRVEKGRVRNNEVSVWADREHGLCMEVDGHTIQDLITFETEGERGDLYTHSEVPGTQQRARLHRSRVALRGPLRGALLLTWRVPVAACEVQSATGELIRHTARELTVTTQVQLDAGRPWVRVVVDGNNDARDMRLRVVFRTGVASDGHFADAAFGRVYRSSHDIASLPGDVERIPRTAPFHRYVSLSDSLTGTGATLISDGLAEYEATEAGDIAVTLLRSVGELSRNDLPERPGHAGWPSMTPAAQCEGPFTASFAVMLHGLLTDDAIVAIEDAADDFLVPLTAWTPTSGGSASLMVPGLAFDGRGLRFESCKEPEVGRGLVVRCTNVLDRPVDGSWSLAGIAEAFLCRLDESPLGTLSVVDGRVAFQTPPFGVTTILLRQHEE